MSALKKNRHRLVMADSGGSPCARKADNGKNGRIGVDLFCGIKAQCVLSAQQRTDAFPGSGHPACWTRNETARPVRFSLENWNSQRTESCWIQHRTADNPCR